MLICTKGKSELVVKKIKDKTIVYLTEMLVLKLDACFEILRETLPESPNIPRKNVSWWNQISKRPLKIWKQVLHYDGFLHLS